MKVREIMNNFTYHPPSSDQTDIYQEIRRRGFELANYINNTCPESPEQTLAIRKVEEAVFWANASVARTPRKEPK